MIPILDLSQDDRALAPALDAAFRDIGFASVVNHGVSATTIADLYAAANAFFDLPADAKRKVKRPRPDQNRGYIGYGEETLARLGGRQTPPDHKEIFSIGPFDLPDDTYYTRPAAYPSFAPNLWPSTAARAAAGDARLLAGDHGAGATGSQHQCPGAWPAAGLFRGDD